MTLYLHELVREVRKENRPLVYIAGPMTNGGGNFYDPQAQHKNMVAACEVANTLWDHGYIPMVPHTTKVWHEATPHEYDWWLRYDAHKIARCCDALYRIGGASQGADLEVELAQRLQIPVFVTLGELDQYFRKNTAPETLPVTVSPTTDTRGRFQKTRGQRVHQDVDSEQY